MFVPLLVLDGLLAVALVVLLVRWSRARGRAATAEARLVEIEARVGQALDAVRRADALADSRRSATCLRKRSTSVGS